MVMIRYIPALVFEEIKMHELVVSDWLSILYTSVPVFDSFNQLDQFFFNPCFFADFAHSRHLWRFARVYDALWQLPPQLGLDGDDRDLRLRVSPAESNAAGGNLVHGGDFPLWSWLVILFLWHFENTFYRKLLFGKSTRSGSAFSLSSNLVM